MKKKCTYNNPKIYEPLSILYRQLDFIIFPRNGIILEQISICNSCALNLKREATITFVDTYIYSQVVVML